MNLSRIFLRHLFVRHQTSPSSVVAEFYLYNQKQTFRAGTVFFSQFLRVKIKEFLVKTVRAIIPTLKRDGRYCQISSSECRVQSFNFKLGRIEGVVSRLIQVATYFW